MRYENWLLLLINLKQNIRELNWQMKAFLELRLYELQYLSELNFRQCPIKWKREKCTWREISGSYYVNYFKLPDKFIRMKFYNICCFYNKLISVNFSKYAASCDLSICVKCVTKWPRYSDIETISWHSFGARQSASRNRVVDVCTYDRRGKTTTVLAWLVSAWRFAFSVGGAAYTYALCMPRASTPATYGCA